MAGAMPVQQLLIPVSTGNGTQQLISIPLSLAAGAGSQIQLLSTPSGQLIATNLAGLGQPLNLSLPGKLRWPSNALYFTAFTIIYSRHIGSCSMFLNIFKTYRF